MKNPVALQAVLEVELGVEEAVEAVLEASEEVVLEASVEVVVAIQP